MAHREAAARPRVQPLGASVDAPHDELVGALKPHVVDLHVGHLAARPLRQQHAHRHPGGPLQARTRRLRSHAPGRR
eukprot:scaffold3705_cov190-Prasinococcus_capsulatus_cf.AAC.1